MLIGSKSLESSRVDAVDGKVGNVTTLLFDDIQWVVRYLVVKRGVWLFGRDVLISPMSVAGVLGYAEGLEAKLTKAQIKSAPAADSAKPVSRRMEEQLHQYYRIPIYWGGTGLWAGAVTPIEAGLSDYSPELGTEPMADIEDEYHIRSSREVIGYRVSSNGEEVGKVADVLVEDTTWAIRYLRVEANNKHGGGMLHVSPHWVKEISWTERMITLDIEPNDLREAPRVGTDQLLDRDEEMKIHAFFGRPRYWV